MIYTGNYWTVEQLFDYLDYFIPNPKNGAVG